MTDNYPLNLFDFLVHALKNEFHILVSHSYYRCARVSDLIFRFFSGFQVYLSMGIQYNKQVYIYCRTKQFTLIHSYLCIITSYSAVKTKLSVWLENRKIPGKLYGESLR